MSTIQRMPVDLPTYGPFGNILVYEWSPMTDGDKGQPISACKLADRSVAGYGNFNGATLSWEGFIGNPDNAAEVDDDDFWCQLTDPSDNYLALTEPKIEAVTQLVVLIRPRVTGGSSANIIARIVVKE